MVIIDLLTKKYHTFKVDNSFIHLAKYMADSNCSIASGKAASFFSILIVITVSCC